MKIKVNIFAKTGDYYGVYELMRVQTDSYIKMCYSDLHEDEFIWEFLYYYNINPSYPNIYIDDADGFYIKFKPEHLNGHSSQHNP